MDQVIDRYDTKKISEELELMKSAMSFPDIQPPKNITEIMSSINQETLQKVDPIKINEYSVLLASYAIFLTKEINTYEARIKWCEANIKHIVGKNVRSHEGYFQEKESYIRATEPLAVKLDQIKLVNQIKMDTLRNIDKQVQFLCTCLQSLAREKSYERRFQNTF